MVMVHLVHINLTVDQLVYVHLFFQLVDVDLIVGPCYLDCCLVGHCLTIELIIVVIVL